MRILFINHDGGGPQSVGACGSVNEPFDEIDADLWEWWRADPLELFPIPSERAKNGFESI